MHLVLWPKVVTRSSPLYDCNQCVCIDTPHSHAELEGRSQLAVGIIPLPKVHRPIHGGNAAYKKEKQSAAATLVKKSQMGFPLPIKY